MNVAVLRQYAVQLEEVAKLELAELSRALPAHRGADVPLRLEPGQTLIAISSKCPRAAPSIRCLGTF